MLSALLLGLAISHAAEVPAERHCAGAEAQSYLEQGMALQSELESEAALEKYQACLAKEPGCEACRYESGWSRFELTTLRKLATALGYRIEIMWRPLRQSGTCESEEQLIRQLGRLFWDRRLERGDADSYPRWIVGRVLQYGKIADIQALCAFLGRERFIGIVSDHRMPSAKLERFWSAMLRLEGVSCTKKPSRPPVSISWPA